MPELPPNAGNPTGKDSIGGFFLVLQWASTLSLAVLAAFLYSVRQVNPSVEFELGVGTFVSALVVGGATHVFFRLLARGGRLESENPRDRRVRRVSLIGWSIILIGGMCASAGRALRTLPSDRFSDMVEGTGLALIFLALLGLVLWRVIRYLEDDHARTLAERGEEQEH